MYLRHLHCSHLEEILNNFDPPHITVANQINGGGLLRGIFTGGGLIGLQPGTASSQRRQKEENKRRTLIKTCGYTNPIYVDLISMCQINLMNGSGGSAPGTYSVFSPLFNYVDCGMFLSLPSFFEELHVESTERKLFRIFQFQKKQT